MHGFFILVFCALLAGCASSGAAHPNPPALIAQAERALRAATDAGAADADAALMQDARRKLWNARQLLAVQAERAGRLAQSAAADARLAEAKAREQQMQRAETRVDASVARIKQRLLTHGI